MTTKVYKYGVANRERHSILSGEETLREQVRLAHAYRGVLIDIEIDRWNRLQAAQREHCTVIDELCEELADADSRIERQLELARAERVRQRKRGEQASAKAELTTLRAIRKGVKGRLSAARKAVRESEQTADLELEWRCVAGRAEVLDRRGKSQDLPCTREEWLAPMPAKARTKLRARMPTIDPVTTGEVRRDVLAAMLQESDHPPHWIARQRIEWDASRARRRARADSGLYHGTYVVVENAVKAAVEKRAKLGQPPRHRWVDTVKVGTQCQGGDTRRKFKLEGLVRRGQNGKRSRAVACVRIASTDKGEPIWCELPIVMHRPLPEGASILWAYVVQRRTGSRRRYEVQLTISMEETRSGQRVEAVAVDVGWRRMPGHVRAAYWVGTDGREGEIRVPDAILHKLEHADHLRSLADTLFDSVRAVVVQYQSELPELPMIRRSGELVPMLDGIQRWRAHRKLVRVARAAWSAASQKTVPLWSEWRVGRKRDRLHLMPTPQEARKVAGDDWLTWYLDCWRRQDEHLTSWAADERTKAIRARDEIFKVNAKRLASEYQTLVLEGDGSKKSGLLDLSKLARCAEPTEAESKADDAQRSQRVKVASAECRAALVKAFRGDVEPEPLERTTTECHHCHGVCEWDTARKLAHKCEHCGESWDQDQNACMNLLCRRRERATRGAGSS